MERERGMASECVLRTEPAGLTDTPDVDSKAERIIQTASGFLGR